MSRSSIEQQGRLILGKSLRSQFLHRSKRRPARNTGSRAALYLGRRELVVAGQPIWSRDVVKARDGSDRHHLARVATGLEPADVLNRHPTASIGRWKALR